MEIQLEVELQHPGHDFWLEFNVWNDGLDIKPTAHQVGFRPDAFPSFGALPTEIRLQIWAFLIQPRIITVACLDTTAHSAAKRAQLAQRRRCPPVPELLHVNREARALARRHFELAFAWKIPHMLVDSSRAPARCAPARVWFNFARDALLLLGELEPFDAFGFNSPMVYFLRREDTHRVRHVACAVEELRYGRDGTEQCLFHILDRFHAVERLVLVGGEEQLKEKGAVVLLQAEADEDGGSASGFKLPKMWRGWINGTSVVTSLLDKQIMMIREDELHEFVAQHQHSQPARRIQYQSST